MAETSRAAPLISQEPVGGPSAPVKTGATMIVACRVPHGMMLRTFDVVEMEEPSQTGMRKFKQAMPNGASFTARGPGRSMLTGLTPEQVETLHPYGYAMTQGCPADLWNSWLNDNRRSPYVLANHIFADTTMERVRNRAKEYAEGGDTLTGLEPIDPDNPAKRVRGEGGLRLMRGERTDRP